MSTPSAAPLPTRQQLDEIDLLLRRMLSLPSLTPETAQGPSTPMIRETTPPVSQGQPPVQSWRVEWPQTPPPASVAAWGSPAPTAPPTPWTNEIPATASVPFASPVVPSVVPLATAVSPVSVSPLVLLNGTFNLLTYLAGPLGTWLRGPGRTYLGWGGILMIMVSLGWAAGDWLGYDWPRLDLQRFKR